MNAVTTTENRFPISEVQTMARAIAASGLFGVKTVDQAFGLMLVAQAEGRHPATVAQEYDIIQGRPALKAQAALARFQAAGGSIRWIKRGPTECAAEFKHPQGGELEISWTMKRAQDAKLTSKENWQKFPDQMLSARVVAEGVRAVFPACLSGVYLAEEVADFDQPPRRPAPVQTEAFVVQESPYITPEECHTIASAAYAVGLDDSDICAITGATEGGQIPKDGARLLADEIRRRRAEIKEREAQDASGVPEQN